MSNFHRSYGATEGPLGFPMPDRAARVLDTLLKALPKGKEFEYRKSVVARAPTELNPGERSDVSWISTESVDRAGEVVLAGGMNDSQFQSNPLVTLNHSYWAPPVGKSLWRRRVKDGDLAGIKAKTHYPARPGSLPDVEPWPPDKVFPLVQAGLLNGKSIGFLPTRVHFPDAKECAGHGWPSDVLVIDEWLLLEYACVFMPCNQDALVEAVSKGDITLDTEVVKALGLDTDLFRRPRRSPTDSPVIAFTPEEEIHKAVQRYLDAFRLEEVARRAVQDGLDRARGRV